ncbi:MAG: E3 binding domain-containing protein, partial [Proteobacteria bacterium]|nr:E3 binding domain-containing protein [Pseudomonadota bacterium]
MAIQILMPALSPTMEEGTLAKWLVKEGDSVQSGDLLAEIETDKATMEFEAVDEGIIGKILVAEGTEGVAVNAPIAVLLEDGEDASAMENITDAAPAPKVAEIAEDKATTTPPAATAAPAKSGDRVFATPLARRIAADKGIDIANVTGSGPHGRVIKSDLEATPAKAATPAPAKTAIASSATSDSVKAMYQDRAYEEIPLNGMRKIIAARLTEAKQTIPHFYLRRSIHLDRLMEARKEMNAVLEADGIKLS